MDIDEIHRVIFEVGNSNLRPEVDLDELEAFPQTPEEANTRKVRVFRIAKFPNYPADGFREALEIHHDFLMSVSNLHVQIAFVLSGSSGAVASYIAVVGDAGHAARLSRIFEAEFPGCDIHEVQSRVLSDLAQNTPECGALVGIPSSKHPAEEVEGQIERIARTMAGDKWWFLVNAMPIDEESIARESIHLWEERDLAPVSFLQTRLPAEPGDDAGRSGDTVAVQRYCAMIASLVERLDEGRATGLWRVGCYYGAETEPAFLLLGGLLAGVFSGRGSRIESPKRLKLVAKAERDAAAEILGMLRLFLGREECRPVESDDVLSLFTGPRYTTTLLSREVSTLSRPLLREFPGYELVPTARFSVSPPDPHPTSGRPVACGSILDRRKPTGGTLRIGQDEFSSHALIAGVTGSGKTTTCLTLLRDFLSHEIPFLVLEPVKNEYRRLLLTDPSHEIRLYTLGADTVSSGSRFRFNPLAVPEGVPLIRHVDMLRSVIRATFPMWGPLPFVVERALIGTYRQMGWDLSEDARSGRPPPPRILDLLEEIENLIPTLGYKKDTTDEISAALRTRFGSLTEGAKGTMLNCTRGVPIPTLFDEPCILELKDIADDDDKAFLMGVLFGMLYEYREVNRYTGKPRAPAGGLRHITVLEEAHRIFPNVSTAVRSENIADPRAGAVTTLCNMLAEVRAYGEGLVIVEQIPSKLASDAIKNTSVKIFHRTVAGDDRKVLASSVGLNENQEEFLTHLHRSEAVWYSESLNYPVLCGETDPRRRPKFPDPPEDAALDSLLGTGVDARATIPPEGPFSGCEFCPSICNHLDEVRPYVNDPGLKTSIRAIYGQTDKPRAERLALIRGELYRALAPMRLDLSGAKAATYCAFVQLGNGWKWSAGSQGRRISTPRRLVRDEAKQLLRIPD